MQETEENIEIASEVVDAAPELKHELATTEYAPILQGLAAVKARVGNVAYPVSTMKGMGEAKADRYALVKLRTSLEAERKKLKAPTLQRAADIDSVARAIEREIIKVETPIDEQITAEENRKAAEKAERIEAERQRVAAIMSKIDAIRSNVAGALRHDQTAAVVADRITFLREMVLGDEYAEKIDEARLAMLETIDALDRYRLQKVHSEARAAEIEQQAAKDRQELAARKAADAEADRKRKAEQKAQDDERERLMQIERKAQADRDAARDEELRQHRAEVDRLRAEASERDRVEREKAEAAQAEEDAKQVAQQAEDEAKAQAERAVEEQRQQAERDAELVREQQARRIIGAAGRMRELLARVFACIENEEVPDGSTLGHMRQSLADILAETALQPDGAPTPKRGPGRPRRT